MFEDDDIRKKLEGVFKNTNFISLVDIMARRYGQMPTDLLTKYDIFEFTMNSAIMLLAMTEEDKARAEADPKKKKNIKTTKDLKGFGIEHKVVKKSKEN